MDPAVRQTSVESGDNGIFMLFKFLPEKRKRNFFRILTALVELYDILCVDEIPSEI